MTDVMEKVGEDIAKAGVAVAHGLREVFSIADKTVKVLSAVVKDEGTLKPVLISATQAAFSIAESIVKVEQEKGLNWADDTALLAQVEAFFKTTIEGMLVPAVEKVYGDLEQAVK